MTIAASEAVLSQIRVELIDRNPENPRLMFRQREMEQLLDSIQTYGVQVPVSVYKSGKRYVLIDGERRWLCALRLNKRTIPALVQEAPSRLQNLLLMFNIHALREQWDLLTIAMKLAPIAELVEEQTGRKATERELAERTGLTRAVIRRCKYLLELPEEYRLMILDELVKPKQLQKLTEDFFIEMERALKTVQNRMPALIPEPDKDRVRQTLIQKYKQNVIPNVVHFRQLAKIARAESVDADQKRAETVLEKLFKNNTYSIEKAFSESVSEAYLERDIETRIRALLDRLNEIESGDLDEDVREALAELQDRIGEILGR